MKFLKKIHNFFHLGVGGYIATVGVILGFIGFIFACVSNTYLGYNIDEMAWIVVLSLISVALFIFAAFMGNKRGNDFLTVYLPLLIAGVLFGVCFIFVINARSYLMGTLWFTQLDVDNPDAVGAMNTGAPSFILFFISMVVIAVSGFFNFKSTKEIKPVEEKEEVAAN